ncbi:hypothetical protein ACFVW1_07945 [Streptomyces olivochromogenes]|uniref:hypothetical protein n=1 Tax=Streptomyces olivochromogenes TaxID=1963 RepID=UPI0036DE9C95
MDENANQYKEKVLSGTLSQGFCSCSKVSAATLFPIGASMMTNVSRMQLYKYRVKEAEYPSITALDSRKALPPSGTKDICRFDFGVGMHQRIATMKMMVLTPAMTTQPAVVK